MNKVQIEGKNSVLEALKSNRRVYNLYVLEKMDDKNLKAITSLALSKNISIKKLKKHEMDTMSKTRSAQGIIAECEDKRYVSLDELLEFSRSKKQEPFYLILDGLEDPGNFGAILRSAESFGVHGVIVREHRAVGLTSAVWSTSCGALEYVNICQVTNIARSIDYLKQADVWIVGADSKGDASLRQADLAMPLAIVVGSEGKGLSRLVGEKCDYVVNIPTSGQLTSLNASVAAGIIMYEAYSQKYT